MRDQYGRTIEYLRISVTDRCNLRCTYCIPAEGMEWLPRAEVLRFEEIERFVRVVAGLGIRKLRLTGGEPLLRKDLPRLVERLVGVPGIEDVGMTTNAVGLKTLARPLRDAGLRRVAPEVAALEGAPLLQLAALGAAAAAGLEHGVGARAVVHLLLLVRAARRRAARAAALAEHAQCARHARERRAHLEPHAIDLAPQRLGRPGIRSRG